MSGVERPARIRLNDRTYHPGSVGYELGQALAEQQAEIRRLRDGIEALADTIDGDDGVAHNYGCEGEPTCLACIVADLRLIASGSDQRMAGGAA